MKLWVNGALVPLDAPVIRADDHGLVVGDGVFETIAVVDGVPFALTRHLRRLRASADGLGMSFDEAYVREGVAAVLTDTPQRARLRITITGGPSPYGSDRGDGPRTVIVATGTIATWPATTDVAIVPWVRNERSATVGLKTTSYADNVVALAWAHERHAAEAIFANTRGQLCEGTGSNVFVEQDGRLVTPPLTSGCLAGITRELLLEWLVADGMQVAERDVAIEQLQTTSEAFITSTTRDVQPIANVDGTPLPHAPGPLTRQAADVFARHAAESLDPKVGAVQVTVGAEPLTVDQVVAVARDDAAVAIAAEALDAMAASRAQVEALAHAAEPHYGISTGFGALATTHIPPDRRADLQRSLIRSHAASSGPVVEREVVRALMLLRLRTLTTGRTGIRPVVAERLAALLNAGISPVVREYGSLGCSGDLAPLAHVALLLMGEGERGHDLAEFGVEPVVLEEKEGLALINGTEGMLAMLLLSIHDLRMLVTTADIAAAMSVEALLGTDRVFADDLQKLRPQPGQRESAANMRAMLSGSAIVASHRGSDDTRVQDAYSLRCAPQVAGAMRDTIAHAATVASYELASAIDNPVVLADGRVESNGNFHGAPIGYVLDFLAIAVADLASMSERRTDRMLDKNRSHDLPPFLAAEAGVDSGLMIAQYTQAGIVSELKRLAVPASVDSIPSSAMQEDHVSMGWAAGRKLRRAIDGLTRVLAIELMAAARALELRAPLQPATATAAVIAALRAAGVGGAGPDRYLSPEIEAATAAVRDGSILAAAHL